MRGVRMAENWPRYTESGLIATAAAVSSAGAIDGRPLQCRRLRSFKPLKFPAVYQPLPVSIPRGRCLKRIGLISAPGISHRRPLRRGNSRRGDLSLDGIEDNDRRDGQRGTDQKVAHPGIFPPNDDVFASISDPQIYL